MKIFESTKIREADAYTIENEPITSIDLMERAAKQCSKWIKKRYKKNRNIAVLIGPGNNGGDAWAIARHLLEADYQLTVFNVHLSDKYSDDYKINKNRFTALENVNIKNIEKEIPDFSDFDLLIDGILGSGLTRPIEGLLADLIQHINSLGKEIIAIDIPTGLFAEDNSNNKTENIIQAQHTLTFQFPKLSFLFPENEIFVGQWEILDIGIHHKYIEQTSTKYYLTEKKDLNIALLERKTFSHKGSYGHSLIFAGGMGKIGAAILAAEACLRSGSGLLTVLVPEDGNGIMQMALPEAMTHTYRGELIDDYFPELDPYTTVGLGPGIGQSQLTLKILKNIITQATSPLVIDADAINLIAQNPELLENLPKESILTPHPKELERLIGSTNNHYERLYKTQEYAQKYQIYILVKGAYSVIVSPTGDFYFNSTGNPGMATAGSGDVLTGVITALLSQGVNSFDALQIAVYVHGKAGDIAKKKRGEISLIAGDIVDNLGTAFQKIKK